MNRAAGSTREHLFYDRAFAEEQFKEGIRTGRIDARPGETRLQWTRRKALEDTEPWDVKEKRVAALFHTSSCMISIGMMLSDSDDELEMGTAIKDHSPSTPSRRRRVVILSPSPAHLLLLLQDHQHEIAEIIYRVLCLVSRRKEEEVSQDQLEQMRVFATEQFYERVREGRIDALPGETPLQYTRRKAREDTEPWDVKERRVAALIKSYLPKNPPPASAPRPRECGPDVDVELYYLQGRGRPARPANNPPAAGPAACGPDVDVELYYLQDTDQANNQQAGGAPACGPDVDVELSDQDSYSSEEELEDYEQDSYPTQEEVEESEELDESEQDRYSSQQELEESEQDSYSSQEEPEESIPIRLRRSWNLPNRLTAHLPVQAKQVGLHVLQLTYVHTPT
ncbi:hypothetical protein GE061_005987 [Apolygus lucorum]|uniref:Uncharacterized protein n=1 Tax=Apolygus lucorum TaxID=248454 RepID=A0A8S9WU10_APOLU|nr:hypothetical protein GE061_005987 [Apolygus lucorum]